MTDLRHDLVNWRTGDRYRVDITELTIPHGGITSILGPSGSGKTTVLQLAGLALRPFCSKGRPAATAFDVAEVAGDGEGRRYNILELWAKRSGRRTIASLRRRLFGFCLQRGELLASHTVWENAAVPLQLNGWDGEQIGQRVEEMLRTLSGEGSSKLWRRRRHLPGQLSGGEYQRVALARALAHRPQLLFLDEPTSELDAHTAAQALELLAHLQRNERITVVIITHDVALAHRYADFIVHMSSPSSGRGTVSQFQRRADDGWRTCNAHWQSVELNEENQRA